MAEFTTTYTVNCPACDSGRVVKIGIRNGEQRYLCRGCRKKFQANGKAPGRRMDADMMGSAIRDYYTGKSYKQVAEGLKEEYDLPNEPSKATIYEWVRDYTDQALKEMEGHKAQTGGHWVADEMQVKVGGKKMWLWNVMDSETRYILASHLTPRRDANAARVVLRKAALGADKPPKTITTDKLRSYMPAIKSVLPEARHIQSEGLQADINNNLSERLQGTFRSRIKTLRGMDSRVTGQRYLDGWVLTYNNFRGHESLRNQTPGYRAKVNPPFREWADVVKVGAVLPKPGPLAARPSKPEKATLADATLPKPSRPKPAIRGGTKIAMPKLRKTTRKPKRARTRARLVYAHPMRKTKRRQRTG